MFRDRVLIDLPDVPGCECAHLHSFEQHLQQLAANTTILTDHHSSLLLSPILENHLSFDHLIYRFVDRKIHYNVNILLIALLMQPRAAPGHCGKGHQVAN